MDISFKILYLCSLMLWVWSSHTAVSSSLSNALSAQESERKAYNPRPFCKTYTMDKQPLNTGEQKDMTEFFTDLITKIEEMSQELVNTQRYRSHTNNNQSPTERNSEILLISSHFTVSPQTLQLFLGIKTQQQISLL